MQTHPESSHSPLAYLTTIDSNHRFDNCSFGGNSTARLRRGRITIKLITLPPGSEREREREREREQDWVHLEGLGTRPTTEEGRKDFHFPFAAAAAANQDVSETAAYGDPRTNLSFLKSINRNRVWQQTKQTPSVLSYQSQRKDQDGQK